MLDKIIYNFLISLDSIAYNKTRALLTSLGIIFGVASVIAMLAIGKGAQEAILDQIKLLGANNIIITPVIKQEEGQIGEESDEGSEEEGTARRPYTPGLTLADAESIREHIPGVEVVSPETVFETVALRGGYRRSIKLVGVDHTYFEDTDFKLAEGAVFTDQQLATAAPVAIIGHDVKVRFFPGVEPLGRQIKCGQMWLTVVGVLQERNVSSQHMERLGIRNYDLDIYTPINTMLLRYENRGQMTAHELEEANRNAQRGLPGSENYHQLDRLVVRVASSDYVTPVAETVSRMLERRHYGVVDYEVIVPEVLLQQEQQTQDIFNIVLAAIASISLIVGGIGIMNIMLASVMERIREIGVRRAIGATRQDVILQFLIEAMTISFTGGVLGILLGIGLSIGIEHSTGIATYVSIESVLLAFLVSFCVGLVFGLLPAKRAAEQDPVTSLRYE